MYDLSEITIIIPWNKEKNISSIGIGLADMPNKCPKTYEYLCLRINILLDEAKIITIE